MIGVLFDSIFGFMKCGAVRHKGDKKMKDFKVTVTGETGSISYEVRKTAKGAESFGKKVAAEAFYGERCTIEVVEIA